MSFDELVDLVGQWVVAAARPWAATGRGNAWPSVRVEQIFGVATELGTAGVGIGQRVERLLGIGDLIQRVLQNDAHTAVLHVVEEQRALAGGIGARRSIAFDQIDHPLVMTRVDSGDLTRPI